ncbi:Arc family DNA-binding protein [Enterobacter asburiae]|uniref:Arc family DNA-binding protein n=1 Tax=Enterobacter asburiae TaxID=61645 RepID=UPI00192AB4EA|nr:Arc family DNA-binding protein [Enterobacter asburiae]MBL5945846.1 Arc family DNA-binding protein [Enterobacter asburiae]MBL5954368.1 Arc family DNA-binding protein [Enterobacter asburiae]
MSERKYRNPQVNLRIPLSLKESITFIARNKGRSANAEMVEALQYWVSEFETKKQSNIETLSEKIMNMEADISRLKSIANQKK